VALELPLYRLKAGLLDARVRVSLLQRVKLAFDLIEEMEDLDRFGAGSLQARDGTLGSIQVLADVVDRRVQLRGNV
jgi:hypothetical protein